MCSKGQKLLPDHQEAHQPVSDPQETGQEQHAPLLHRRAVCRRRPAHVQELRYVQLRKFAVRTSGFPAGISSTCGAVISSCQVWFWSQAC